VPRATRQCDDLAALAVRTGLHAPSESLRSARSRASDAIYGLEDDIFETEIISS